MTQTLKAPYNIAAAFIMDKDTTLDCGTPYQDGCTYEIVKRGVADYPYRLTIHVPYGKPCRYGMHNHLMNHKTGTWEIARGTGIDFGERRTLIEAETRFPVGYGVHPKAFGLTKRINAMFEPEFFQLIDLLQKRIDNKLQLRDNTAIIAKFIQQTCPNR